MARILAAITAVCLVIAIPGMCSAQGYYGSYPAQYQGYGGQYQGMPGAAGMSQPQAYGQQYAQPEYGQPSYGAAPGYQGYGDYMQSMQGYPGATGQYPAAAGQYPGAGAQYPGADQYAPAPQQGAPNPYYYTVPGSGGQSYPMPDQSDSYTYADPGALVEQEIYWDPRMDAAEAREEAGVVEQQPQPVQPPAPAIRQARTAPRAVQRPTERSAVTTRSPRQTRRSTPKPPASSESIKWGKKASEPEKEEKTFSWGKSSKPAMVGSSPGSSSQQADRPDSGVTVETRSADKKKFHWGKN